jgi:Bromodomain
VKKRLESGGYRSFEDFAADCRLTFDNAISYNEDGSEVLLHYCTACITSVN